MASKKLPPIHPGEILLEEFLKPMGISQYRLSKDIGVPPRRINEIVHGKRSITADTALRLARYFGTSERFWMNLQSRYDQEVFRFLAWESKILEHISAGASEFASTFGHGFVPSVVSQGRVIALAGPLLKSVQGEHGLRESGYVEHPVGCPA